MCLSHFRSRPDAKPLTPECVQELIDEDCAELIVELDGAKYNGEDLYSCDGCERRFVSHSDLDEDGYCETCAEEARDEAAHQRQLRSDYYASVL